MWCWTNAAPCRPTLRPRFSAIIVAGVCGGLIGFSVMDLGCDGGCTTTAGLVGLGTAVIAAAGTGIVAVLTLRAAAEWRAQQPVGSPRGPLGEPRRRRGS